MLHSKLVIHLLSALADVLAFTQVIHVGQTLPGLSLGLLQDVFDLWIILEGRRHQGLSLTLQIEIPHRANVIPYSTCQRCMFVQHSIFISERFKAVHPAEHAPSHQQVNGICVI